MDLKHILAANLRQLRGERDLTQEDVAEMTGLSSRYIGSIERARVSPSVTILGKLAQAFKVDPCLLITKQGRAAK